MSGFWRRAALALTCTAVLFACDSNSSGKSDGGANGGNNTGNNANGSNANGGNANGNNTDAGNTGPDGSVIPAGSGSVSGFVYDTNSNVLKGVKISGLHGETAVTDSKGAFSLSSVGAADDVALLALLDNYTAGVRNVGVVKDQSSYVEFYLKRTFKGVFEASKGGYLRSPEGAGVKFEAGSLVTKKDGKVAEGKVTVELTPIDPTKPAELKAFPGHFQAKNGDKEGLLETYVPMEVKAKNADGDELQIKSDSQATYEFPVPEGLASVPDQIDVWTLDEKTGVWVHEGVAKRTKNGDGKEIYVAEVKHMSWWNCDSFIDSITCVRGCVASAGKPVTGAVVTFTGVGWRFRGTDTTDKDGCVYANLKQQSEVSIFAANASGFSQAKGITTDAVSKRWEAGKQACADIGTLELAPAPAGIACPAGYTSCDSRCYDLENDGTHCGDSCDLAVACTGKGDFAASGPSKSICQAGECICPSNWLLCDAVVGGSLGTCRNNLRDHQFCGTTCQNLTACSPSQVCVAGACTELTCPEPQTACTSRSQTANPYCSNLLTDTSNCGTCGTRCGLRDANTGGAEFSCVAGACGCAADLTACGASMPPPSTPSSYTCSDLTSNAANCSSCYQLGTSVNEGARCAGTQNCVSSLCTELVCGTGQAACAHECIDVTADSYNCGACNAYCQDGKTCQDSACACPTGQTYCSYGRGSSCTDTLTNRSHCGGCSGSGGAVCATGQECVAGACQAILCGTKTLCGDRCVDTSTDESNCGGCSGASGVQCSGSKQCNGGTCACNATTQKLCCPGVSEYCAPLSGTCLCTIQQ